MMASIFFMAIYSGCDFWYFPETHLQTAPRQGIAIVSPPISHAYPVPKLAKKKLYVYKTLKELFLVRLLASANKLCKCLNLGLETGNCLQGYQALKCPPLHILTGVTMDIYDRIPYSAIVDRKPLTLPDGGRVIP